MEVAPVFSFEPGKSNEKTAKKMIFLFFEKLNYVLLRKNLFSVKKTHIFEPKFDFDLKANKKKHDKTKDYNFHLIKFNKNLTYK